MALSNDIVDERRNRSRKSHLDMESRFLPSFFEHSPALDWDTGAQSRVRVYFCSDEFQCLAANTGSESYLAAKMD